ncbi:hypothetical protein SLAV_03385 [Streptomyces lavendulae subsp. lavendulae]|uniref:Uncharacterized protein n=1 Tax=Streptomyces lavendulae subsp. lavendulae TaxID=58340 RepID=A0A2K8PAC1_STRLA|nr:hypothetical protein [Streptomyces lavendulae]ATZ22585.1 hypothetical protein SLAV_03385 [Streptomyces lavendulae subsp. lavendulae]QUQ52427.1 hypothetical protein SLLC_01420 [Streptomyces lavendulae subsp. lavendulae]
MPGSQEFSAVNDAPLGRRPPDATPLLLAGSSGAHGAAKVAGFPGRRRGGRGRARGGA